MNVALIINPMATSYKDAMRTAVLEAIGSHPVAVMETKRRDHATDLAKEASATGAGVVVVLGGDGTMNEVANGLAGSDTPMLALPGGSTNVYARTLGMHRKARKAIAQLPGLLDGGTPKSVSVGRANGRLFLFHVGLGFDAAVVERVERNPERKRKLGQLAFVLATMATVRSFDRKRPHFTVEVPGAEPVSSGFAVCLKTNPYTFLGRRPFDLAPDAGLHSPLAMVTLRSLKLPTTMSIAGSALYGKGKRMRRHKVVDYRPGLSELTVRFDTPFHYQADGEYLGTTTELTLSYEPDVLRIIGP